MFIKKSTVEDLLYRIECLERNRYIKQLFCEICGCSLTRYIKGEPEIRKHEYDILCQKMDEIYYPCYCLIHAPEKIKKGE